MYLLITSNLLTHLQAADLTRINNPGIFNRVQKSGTFGPDDPHIRYYGRWNKSDASKYTSFWGGAYFKLKFTGKRVKMSLGHKSNYYVRIDNGPWISYKNVTGIIEITPTPLSQGTHTLSVAQGKDYDYQFDFMGITLDQGARLLNIDDNTAISELIEWIGDSITSGYTDPQAEVSDYAWVCSEMLGVEHTQIAYPGINLVSGYHGQGMDIQYRKERSLKYPAAKDWDFSTYDAQVIVINLGTNDVNNHVPGVVFEQKYEAFLSDLRKQFPKAEIFAMRTFSGAMATQTKAAVQARSKEGDTKLHFINTENWLKKGTDDFTDGTHPSESGHLKVARLLKSIIAPYIDHAHD